ncbi:hypothetical protein TVAGG3_0000760 [Trichomonas vaginalis G3]|nr:hypothetical protein TVAGG3_0000760 [Trichomonas vaginalis G3]KAI5538597.1 hypothetical protein TVAGG3_0000760 [Trichomonas vaginalis G3]
MALNKGDMTLAPKDSIIFNFLNSDNEKKPSGLGAKPTPKPNTLSKVPVTQAAPKQKQDTKEEKSHSIRIPDFEEIKLSGIDFSKFQAEKKDTVSK